MRVDLPDGHAIISEDGFPLVEFVGYDHLAVAVNEWVATSDPLPDAPAVAARILALVGRGSEDAASDRDDDDNGEMFDGDGDGGGDDDDYGEMFDGDGDDDDDDRDLLMQDLDEEDDNAGTLTVPLDFLTPAQQELLWCSGGDVLVVRGASVAARPEDALGAPESGSRLAAHCQAWLRTLGHAQITKELIESALGSLTRRCLVCQDETYSAMLTTCPKQVCQFGAEDMGATETRIERALHLAIVRQPQVMRLAVRVMLSAAQHDKLKGASRALLEPFPSAYIASNLQGYERNTMSSLRKTNSRANQDAKRFEPLIKDLTAVLALVDGIVKAKADSDDDPTSIQDQLRKLSWAQLTIAWFAFATLRTHLFVVDPEAVGLPSDCEVYMLNGGACPERECAFQAKATAAKSQRYFYHGTKDASLYGILHHGLRSCSGTAMMTTGSAHGAGVYLSPAFNTAMSYSDGSSYLVCEATNPVSRSPDIFTSPDDERVAVRFLVCSQSGTLPHGRDIKQFATYYNEHVVEPPVPVEQPAAPPAVSRKRALDVDEANMEALLPTAAKRLLKDVSALQNTDLEALGIGMELMGDSLSKWTCKFFGFDSGSALQQDLARLAQPTIDLEITFPNDYPMTPPFVRILRPQFEHMTGHITLGGAVCMQFLTRSGWSPVSDIEGLLVSIRSQILAGGARVKCEGSYRLEGARESFDMLVRRYGWS